jgi:uncharacterized protein YdiU (UPF0061 family)
MGLIDQNHDHVMNSRLEKILLETFSLRIINEYDIAKKRSYKKIPNRNYMATRYLQLQHKSKTGKTSGDGRSIWNGEFRGKKTWDISSCGTGATCLSPATVLHGKFFSSGDPGISYGCGTADLEDGVAAVLMSEVFQSMGYPTERTLAIIQYNKGESINVRAGTNLIRPAHFFRYLKQNNWKDLKILTDFFIQRQVRNRDWTIPEGSTGYEVFLEKSIDAFARSAALFESYYIFCWLDWDGDNILASNAGILDYGSVRQFGLFHKGYRYDDVERWSTTLLEQKNKARYIVQCFDQMIDYINKKKKRPLRQFENSYATKKFNDLFEYYKLYFLLERVGVKKSLISEFLNKNEKVVKDFQKSFQYFEHSQSAKGTYKVSDGVSTNAVFCMRDFLREFPKSLLTDYKTWEWQDFVKCTQSKYALKKDLFFSKKREYFLYHLQNNYCELMDRLSKMQNKTINSQLLEITLRSSWLNRHDRITGNGALLVTHKILKKNKRAKNLFQSIESFLDQHLGRKKTIRKNSEYRKLANIILDNAHDI